MSLSKTAQPYTDGLHRASQSNRDQCPKIDKGDLQRKIGQVCEKLPTKPGVYSSIIMNSTGFQYTGSADAARCKECGLEVSGWTLDMKPFEIHSQRSPSCDFVRSMRPKDSFIDLFRLLSLPVGTLLTNNQVIVLMEAKALEEARQKTFSHWPHQSSLTKTQMAQAGFFACRVGDRVICIYCKLICQYWIPHTDDPSLVHSTLSPRCPFVLSMSASRSPWPGPLLHVEAAGRHESSATWPTENLSSVNTSIQHAGDNQAMEHARLSTQSQRTVQQERVNGSDPTEDYRQGVNDNRPSEEDESELSQLVAARIDHPVPRSVMRCGFKPYIVERCLRDQLRLKEEEFADPRDLSVSCMILEHQIQCIGGKKEKIIVPHVAMKKIQDESPRAVRSGEQVECQSPPRNSGNGDDAVGTSTSLSGFPRFVESVEASSTGNAGHQEDTISASLSCCDISREAFIPCRHLYW